MTINKDIIELINNLSGCDREREINQTFDMMSKYDSGVLLHSYIDFLIRNAYMVDAFNRYEKASKMVKNQGFEGWCFQTTTFLAPFFPNTANISRGEVQFSSYEKTEHAWIEFILNNKSYIFDPSCNFLCDKKIYEEKLKAEIICKISAEKARKELIDCLSENKKDGIYIPGTENIEEVFYRTNSQVKGKTKGKRIESLYARYYNNF